MIVGGYDLHLYCRHEDLPLHYDYLGRNVPPGHHLADEFPHEFHGRNEREAMAKARRKGWRFRDGDAECPRCVTNSRRLTSPTKTEPQGE